MIEQLCLDFYPKRKSSLDIKVDTINTIKDYSAGFKIELGDWFDGWKGIEPPPLDYNITGSNNSENIKELFTPEIPIYYGIIVKITAQALYLIGNTYTTEEIIDFYTDIELPDSFSSSSIEITKYRDYSTNCHCISIISKNKHYVGLYQIPEGAEYPSIIIRSQDVISKQQ